MAMAHADLIDAAATITDASPFEISSAMVDSAAPLTL